VTVLAGLGGGHIHDLHSSASKQHVAQLSEATSGASNRTNCNACELLNKGWRGLQEVWSLHDSVHQLLLICSAALLLLSGCLATTADSWWSHLARTALDDHETVLADGTGRLGEGVRGTGFGGLKGLVICLQGAMGMHALG